VAFDLLIAGAGPVGCTIAERAATVCGWRSLVIDKRDHVAGNCYDRIHESGVLIHEYGPHYFRTNNRGLLDYLSRFTEWIPGNYRVKSLVHGALYPFPINIDTLEQFFNVKLDPESAERLLASHREVSGEPRNSEELMLSRVGWRLYEAFYLNYTRKQWDRHPRELDPSVCGRIPVRLNRDSRYVDQTYQVMPSRGFTALFSRMLDHPLISVRLRTDYASVAERISPRIATVYCGPIDAYFQFSLGRLSWRSLKFTYQVHAKPFVQPCVQINYPNDCDYTRTVEFKHVTGQQHPHTVVSREYPSYDGDPYYPVPQEEQRALYRRYETLAQEETRARNVFFCGRLATYRYINTDQAIEEALQLFETIRARHAG
jgi:UDP-galactopyranose mutase